MDNLNLNPQFHYDETSDFNTDLEEFHMRKAFAAFYRNNSQELYQVLGNHQFKPENHGVSGFFIYENFSHLITK